MSSAAAERTGNWLGGSDLPVVVGVSPFKSRLDLFLQKTGQTEPEDESEAMRWGVLLEDQIAREWARREGVKIRRRNKELQHPKVSWLRAHLDRDIVGQKAILEVKTSSADGWGDAADDVPDHVAVQCHAYMAVTGAEKAFVAALLWGRWGPPSLHSYELRRDEEIAGAVIQAGHLFVTEHLEPRIAPTPESSEEANLLWRRVVTGRHAVVSPEVLRALSRLEFVKEVQATAKTERKDLELLLKSYLREAEAGVDEADQPLYTWKRQTQDRFDEAALREKAPKIHARYRKTVAFRKLHITKLGREAAAMVAQQLEEQHDEATSEAS